MKKLTTVTTMVAVLLMAGTALADWDPGDPYKWLQLPDETSAGMDIRVDQNDGITRTLADDFLCTSTERITDVHLWGSWLNDQKGAITSIHLSIHADIPDPDGTGPLYSMPGQELWARDFTVFSERHWKDISPAYEWWWDPTADGQAEPDGDQNIWQYNILIDPSEAFEQQGTASAPVVYWLDVAVTTDGQGQFGWKTSQNHWNDDAVFWDDTAGWLELRYPDGHPQHPESIDMAFVITPEPMTMLALVAGLPLLLKRRRS